MAGPDERTGRLEEALVRLAEAQARTEERLGGVEDAQGRSEERLGRVEEALARLAEAQARLAEAQAATQRQVEQLAWEQRQLTRAVEELVEGLDRLRKQVGGLSDTVGGDIEDVAYTVIHYVLEREFGWKVGLLERSWETWDGEPEEVNLLGVATDPARPEVTIWIVGEAKHNLTVREVEGFARLVERARRNLAGEVFPVCFCYRARPEVQQKVLDAGLRMVYSYGKLV